MLRTRPTKQNYDLYTPQDFNVWRLLYDRQMQLLTGNASERYLYCLKQIGFNRYEIPKIKTVNRHLLKATGWQLTIVPGLVPAKEFFSLLSQKVFPVTCWLRTIDELDYIEEPDMFHDVFGHVPLIMNRSYADFLEGLGKLGVKWINAPEIIAQLGCIYWFTIEFGLLSESNDIKVFGSGIISSVKETLHSLSNVPVRYPFDITKMMSTLYSTDSLQGVYFVIDSFEHLCSSLAEIEAHLQRAYMPVLE